MSVAFTNVADWTNVGQGLVGVNELVLAYSERKQVLGIAAVDPLTAGVSGMDKTLWLEMQEWCEANCTSFIDHVSGPLNAGSTDFLYFTLATWRAAAGLHADGFRRRVEPDDADSYGVIQIGDTRGDWCFEDLQKGFSALRWATGFTSASYWNLVTGGSARGPGTDITPMQYAGVNGTYRFLYGMDLYFYDSGSRYPGHFFAGIWIGPEFGWPAGASGNSRKRVDVTFQKIAGLDGTADIYFKGKGYPNWGTAVTFADLDGLGITNGGMLFYTTLVSMDNTSTGLLGGTDMTYVAPTRGYSCDILVARKWDFTNQNT